MQQSEQLIINLLTNVEGFVRSNVAEGQLVYYSVHYDHKNTINHKSPTTAKQFEGLEMDEALTHLLQDVRRTAEMQNKYLLIALRKNEKDPAPVYYTSPNPLYTTGSTVAGIGNVQPLQMPSNGSPSFMEVMMLMQQHQQQLELQRQENARLQTELLKTIYEQKLEAKEQEIAAAYNSGSGSFIERLLENDAILAIVNNLTSAPTETKKTIEQIEKEQQEQPKTTGEAQTDKNQLTQEQIEKRQQAAINIQRIKAVFPDINEFFADLAAFVENDPNNAKFYRGLMKQKGKNNG